MASEPPTRQCSRCGKVKRLYASYPAKDGRFTDYCRACIKPSDGFRKLRARRQPEGTE